MRTLKTEPEPNQQTSAASGSEPLNQSGHDPNLSCQAEPSSPVRGGIDHGTATYRIGRVGLGPVRRREARTQKQRRLDQ